MCSLNCFVMNIDIALRPENVKRKNRVSNDVFVSFFMHFKVYYLTGSCYSAFVFARIINAICMQRYNTAHIDIINHDSVSFLLHNTLLILFHILNIAL